MKEDTRPLMVTIQCFTYNHEPYIRQCLEGFVMQKTNFRFEAIVHDDASTDGTATIIREYAEKYPDIIKPIYETENLYSKHDGSLRRIMNGHTHGKYVALCEGDDYWIDPLKLQKQVDFMEGHPDYTMCFHNAIEHFEDEDKEDRQFSDVRNKDYKDIDIYKEWLVPTASVVYVNTIHTTEIYNHYIHNNRIIVGDLPLFLTCCHYGKVRGISDVMSIYRRHVKGFTASPSVELLDRYATFQKEIPKIFGNHLKTVAERHCVDFLLEAMRHCKLEGKKSDAKKYMKKAFHISASKTIYIILKDRILRVIKKENA